MYLFINIHFLTSLHSYTTTTSPARTPAHVWGYPAYVCKGRKAIDFAGFYALRPPLHHHPRPCRTPSPTPAAQPDRRRDFMLVFTGPGAGKARAQKKSERQLVIPLASLA